MDTWMILVAIGLLVLVLIATVASLLVYSGAFETVKVGAGKPPIGKVTIAYKFERGSYKNVGPVFSEAYSIAPKYKQLGIYYDDPKKVESHRLRYVVASVLAEDGGPVDEDVLAKFESEGFKVMDLPSVEHCVKASFPYSSTLSIAMAATRVYPLLQDYIQEHKLCAHPFLELYLDNVIHFIVPLARQDQFYAQEALQEFPGEDAYESIYSDESTLEDVSQSILDDSQSHLDDSHLDSQSEPSLLDSPDVVRAAFLGGKEEGEGAEKDEEKDRGSDEDSTSSFEELKMDASGAKIDI